MSRWFGVASCLLLLMFVCKRGQPKNSSNLLYLHHYIGCRHCIVGIFSEWYIGVCLGHTIPLDAAGMASIFQQVEHYHDVLDANL